MKILGSAFGYLMGWLWLVAFGLVVLLGWIANKCLQLLFWGGK